MTTENTTVKRKPIPWTTVIVGSIIAIGIIYYAYTSISNARRAASTVVARVNGEAIYESDVNRGLPDDSFDSTVDDLRQNKLETIITRVAVRQFLSKHHIHVRKGDIDKEVDQMEKNPPSKGCPCCTYPSLDAYLTAMGMTRDELRQDIEGKLGLMDYTRKSWRKSHSDKKSVMKEIGSQSDFIRQHYVKAWQIFFNTFQQPGYNSDPDKIIKIKGQIAQKAWGMLQRGKSFDAVAKSISDDMTSKHKGGSLGFIDRSTYGQEVDDAISHLKPGQYSKPIQSSWGFHIIKWSPMNDDDIISFCESYFVNKEYDKLYSRIMKSAKIERVKPSDNAG